MKEHTLTLQVLSNKVQQIPTSIVQNDSDTNVILISLVDATNKPYSLGTITSIGCKVLKENGNIAILGTSNVITTDWANGKIKVTLPSLAVSQAGVCQAVIEFYDTGKRVTTARFSYLVTADIMGSANQQIDVDTAIQLTTLTQNAMGQFESFKTTAQAAEIMRVNNESTRVSNENTRVANESSRSSSESTRVSNESTRTANESTRVSNEIARVNSESTRANAENTRISKENVRIASEETRNTAESTRLTKETARINAESTRAANEDERKNSELLRKQDENSREVSELNREINEYNRNQAELTRQGEEAERLAEETQRIARENARVANESDRVLSEDNRKENESARVTAENNRVNTEATRVSNENSRTAAETTRASNEATRISAESARVTSETARISNENARVISETARINAESTRSTNETVRVNSEVTRASNEAARVNAEAGRVTTFNAQVATIAEKTTTSINGEQSNVNFIGNENGNIDNIEVSGVKLDFSSNVELLDGRVGADGIVYSNVGSAIRGQIGLVSESLDLNYINSTKNIINSTKILDKTFNDIKEETYVAYLPLDWGENESGFFKLTLVLDDNGADFTPSTGIQFSPCKADKTQYGATIGTEIYTTGIQLDKTNHAFLKVTMYYQRDLKIKKLGLTLDGVYEQYAVKYHSSTIGNLSNEINTVKRNVSDIGKKGIDITSISNPTDGFSVSGNTLTHIVGKTGNVCVAEVVIGNTYLFITSDLSGATGNTALKCNSKKEGTGYAGTPININGNSYITKIVADKNYLLFYSNMTGGYTITVGVVDVTNNAELENYLTNKGYKAINHTNDYYSGAFKNINDNYNLLTDFEVDCWGDSLTASFTPSGNTYPAYLSKFLKNIPCNNYGNGGEIVTDICARQGGNPFVLDQDLNIPSDLTSVEISLKSTLNSNKPSINFIKQTNRGLNPVSIRGVQGNITYNTSDSKLYFQRLESGTSCTAKVGEIVYTNVGKNILNNIQIIFSGQNGGYNSLDELVFAIRNMISKYSNNKYIVVAPIYRTNVDEIIEIEARFKKEFGTKVLCLREYLNNYGLEKAISKGLISNQTEQDTVDIANKRIPSSLRADSDLIHLNKFGYYLFAEAVYDLIVFNNYIV